MFGIREACDCDVLTKAFMSFAWWSCMLKVALLSLEI